LNEGFRYAFGFAPIRSLLMLLALVSLMGMPLSTLMPVFARDILHGGPGLLGLLMGATGVGALSAALYLASRASILGLGREIVAAAGMFGLGVIGFSFSDMVPLSLIILVVTGFAMMLQMAGSNTLLQTIVDDDKRGRVMSLYTMAFMGSAPLGSILGGSLAERYGAPLALQVGGGMCLIGAVLFGCQLPKLREQIRPIYRRVGILPEVANAVQISADLAAPPKEAP
jgi:MFS family permease